MEEKSVTEKVKMLESIFGTLVNSALSEEPKPLSAEDHEKLIEAAQFRGLWLEVKGLEDAEGGYRQQAAEAARRHGVATARLMMAGIEDGHPNIFILTIPAIERVDEMRIAAGLQKAIQTMLGGVLMEHEMLKSTMATTIMKVGEHLGGTVHPDLHDLAKAMMELDFPTMAKVLGLPGAPEEDSSDTPAA